MIIVSREQAHERLAKITVVPLSSNDRGWPDEVDAAHRLPGRCRDINAVIDCSA